MSGIRTWTMSCGRGMPVFVAAPASDARTPVVIVMHERYGFARHTRDLAERFARDGFLALAPDFYFQHPDQDALHRGEAGYDMSDPEALMWLEAALEALAEMPQADAGRLAVMGVCQTARHPLVLAASRPIGAALIWYGAAQLREWAVNSKYPRALEEIIAAVGCPVLGMFGETDHLIAIDDVRRLRDCLERHGKTFRIHVYRDAPHGWLNDTMPGRYRAAQAEAAWAEQLAFLHEVLAPDYDRSVRRQRYECDAAVDYDFSRNVRQE
jgi:carboxymethylenebutenolidase